MHPFGRFEGKSAVAMGAEALLEALADAGSPGATSIS